MELITTLGMLYIGAEYAHAEARKSPVVDGKVRRNERGKEERYPVILSPHEKEIARKVTMPYEGSSRKFHERGWRGGWSVIGSGMLRALHAHDRS